MRRRLAGRRNSIARRHDQRSVPQTFANVLKDQLHNNRELEKNIERLQGELGKF